jgi:hypothetical protein
MSVLALQVDNPARHIAYKKMTSPPSPKLKIRVFSEVPFWNSAKYGILYGTDFISRNSAKFFTVQ